MGKRIELVDELHGFYPGNQGSAIVAYSSGSEEDLIATFTSKYAVDFEDDEDGWAWDVGTRLNRQQLEDLATFIAEVLA